MSTTHCCKYQTVRSTNVPTATPEFQTLSRDAALERLLKYLPELRLRLLQKSQNRKLSERKEMKTESSFLRIWTDWLEDKGPFHADADVGEQLQSRASSSLSSIGNEGPSTLREVHQKPQTPTER